MFRKVMIYLVMGLFLLDSGSWVGIQNSALFDSLFFLAGFLFWLITSRRMNKRNLFVTMFFLVVYLLNMLFFVNEQPVYSGYISYSIRLVATLFWCSAITYDCYAEQFEILVVFISLLSLIVYIGFSYLKVINGVTEDGYYFMVLKLFRIYRNYSGSMYRNASIFWEPGAYQLFANMALLFLLRRKNYMITKQWNKHDWLNLFILLISVATTFSTTGYSMTCIIMLLVVLKSFAHVKKIYLICFSAPVLIGVGYIVFRILQSDVIAGKLVGNNVASYSIRANDIVANLRMITSKPLLGYGFGTQGMWEQLRAAGRKTYTNSSGFLMAMSTFGIPFGLLYFKRIVSFGQKYWGNYLFPFLMLVIVSGFTEGFCLYPIYYALLFYFSPEKKQELFI